MNFMLFAADNATNGSEPWITDGTEDGTQTVADIRPGPVGGSPRNFAPFEPLSTLAITASDADKPAGDAGTTPVTFAVIRSGLTHRGGTVDWAVSGTAGEVRFNPGAQALQGDITGNGAVDFRLLPDGVTGADACDLIL